MADYKGQGEKLSDGMKKEITRVRENQEAVEETDLQRMARENMERLFGPGEKMEEIPAYTGPDLTRSLAEQTPLPSQDAAGSPFKQPLPPWPEAPEVAASEPQEGGGHPYTTRANWSPPPQADAASLTDLRLREKEQGEAGTILDDAKSAVTKDRRNIYGAPENSFEAIAQGWNWLLANKGHLAEDGWITPLDVADMLEVMKIARGFSAPGHRDNYVDRAGYAALAGLLAASEGEPE